MFLKLRVEVTLESDDVPQLFFFKKKRNIRDKNVSYQRMRGIHITGIGQVKEQISRSCTLIDKNTEKVYGVVIYTIY